jgi:hypothetical protein
MSTYDQIAWLPLCAGLTGLGLVLSYFVLRRRGSGPALRWAAVSLLPLAAYLTGSIEMFWKMGVAVGDFAKGFVFSPKVWAGIALAGLAVVLFMVSGTMRRKVKQGQDKRATGPGRTSSGGTRTLPAATGGQLATRPDPALAAGAAVPAKPPKARKGKNTDDDDDLGDIEDILRRHGIT